jgi:DNA-binding response OmpR family regulator
VGTIVVFDDDRVMVDLLRLVIEEAGHTALTATNIDEIPAEVRADLVVTDLMPLTSYRADLARRWIRDLRARFPAPVVVVTAHLAATAEPDKLGADAVISKPFDVDALMATIDGLVR